MVQDKLKTILLICESDLLTQLYSTNLEIYLASHVLIAKNLKEARARLERPLIDLIIVDHWVLDEESDWPILSDPPQVLIGEHEKSFHFKYCIKNHFDLRALIKTSATILNLDAKMVMTASSDEYYPFLLNDLLLFLEAPVSMYLEFCRQDDVKEYVLFAQKGKKINEILIKIHSEGVDTIFVKNHDRVEFVNFLSEKVIDELAKLSAPGANLGARINSLSRGFELFVSEAFSPVPGQQIFSIVTASEKIIYQMIEEKIECRYLLQQLLDDKKSFVFTHSFLVAYVCGHMLKKLEWGSRHFFEKINFLCFFHDIYLVKLFNQYPQCRSEEELLFYEGVLNVEKELIINHAHMAAKLSEFFVKRPNGVELLINQHHGIINGQGMALDFLDELSPLSKVFIIAEAFVHEFIKIKEKEMKAKIDCDEMVMLLLLKFNRPTYKKIVETIRDLPL